MPCQERELPQSKSTGRQQGSSTAKPRPAEQVPEPKNAQEGYRTAYRMWSGGNQALAEMILDYCRRRWPTDIRLAFFQAACTRSRFEVREAAPLFDQIARAAPGSVEGRCSQAMLAIDGGREADAGFAALRTLVQQNPTDTLALWMLAVTCRALKRNAEGVEYYRLLRQRIDGVGPVLVHQTYANLLEELGRYQEALPERILAIRTEPETWSVNALLQTLDTLHKYPELIEVASQAVQHFPNESIIWFKWGYALSKLGRRVEAEQKYRRVTQLDPANSTAWDNLGLLLEAAGRYNEAIAMYQRAITADPNNAQFRGDLAALKDRLARSAAAPRLPGFK